MVKKSGEGMKVEKEFLIDGRKSAMSGKQPQQQL